MAVIVIFVEGADTEPDPLPVYLLDNQSHATLICEGLKESEYRIFNFSIKHCTRSDRGRFAVWAKMAIDARDGVYGSIAAGIYDMIDEAHAIISLRRINQETVANPNTKDQSDDGTVLPSSKPENPTKTDNNAALAREQLRPHVEMPEFRQYVKEQILEWEKWHRLQKDAIRSHEIWRDQNKEKLDRGISIGTVDSEDPDDIDRLSYEFHKDIASLIAKSSEFRLVGDREPILFRKASIVAMVALFWCDVNHSNLLVPDYSQLPDVDFLEPVKPFLKYLFEQWGKPIQGRYKHIDWFVEAAINAYESTSDGGSFLASSKPETPTKTDDKLPKKGDELPPPKYDPNSANWILSETLCKLLKIKASSISNYRKPRKCGKDRIDEFGSWSIDCVGKFRRKVNSKGSVAYYRPAMSDPYKAKLAYEESQKLNKP